MFSKRDPKKGDFDDSLSDFYGAKKPVHGIQAVEKVPMPVRAERSVSLI
jgi:hypothetical protein